MVASAAVVMIVSSVIVRYDERRLQRAADRGEPGAEERLERAWPAPSRDNSLIGLPLLASPLLAVVGVWFHFLRTRSRSPWLPWLWSPTGFLLGLAAALVVMSANVAVVVALAMAFGIPLEE
jgi:hypothetical protein